MKRAASTRGEKQCAIRVIAATFECFARPPVLHDFVIVPLSKNGDLGVEIPQIRVKQVVFIVAAIVVEARCDLALFLGHDISPRLAVRQLLLCRHSTVRVNAVAAMDKEVRPIVQHRSVCAHSTARRIDTPALTRSVARPYE